MPTTISIRELPGPLGAVEVTGIDVARDASNASVRVRLCEALAQHGVICVRQTAALDDVQMRALVE